MSKKDKYLVEFCINTEDDVVNTVHLVKPRYGGDATIKIQKVADEEWVIKNLHYDRFDAKAIEASLKGYRLNDKFSVQLKGNEE